MSTPNFADILNTKVDDVKRPPLIPVGTYRARVTKPAIFGEIADGRFQTIDFNLLLVEPQLDVDMDSLAEYGGLTAMSTIRHRFMLNTEQSNEGRANRVRTVFNLTRFLAEHLRASGETINELIANAVGNECLVSVKWRPDNNDPEIQYNEVGRTAPLPD